MARTAITVVKSSRVSNVFEAVVSLTEAAADAVNFNSIANTGKELLVVRNSGGTTRTIKLYDKNGNQIGATQNLLAGKSYAVGPFPVDKYGESVAVDISHAEILAVVVQLAQRGVITAGT
jgi:hypothetical protein